MLLFIALMVVLATAKPEQLANALSKLLKNLWEGLKYAPLAALVAAWKLGEAVINGLVWSLSCVIGAGITFGRLLAAIIWVSYAVPKQFWADAQRAKGVLTYPVF